MTNPLYQLPTYDQGFSRCRDLIGDIAGLKACVQQGERANLQATLPSMLRNIVGEDTIMAKGRARDLLRDLHAIDSDNTALNTLQSDVKELERIANSSLKDGLIKDADLICVKDFCRPILSAQAKKVA
jgi:hypothetical protein